MKKSRSKVKTPAYYKKLEALTEHMGKVVQVNLIKGIKTWRSKISDSAIFNAWSKKDYKPLEKIIRWSDMPGNFEGVDAGISKATYASAEFSIKGLPAPMQKELRFDTKNPRIEKFFEKRSAERVKYISKDTRSVIREAVTKNFDKGWTPRDIATSIRSEIGLLPQHARAVERYRAGLIKTGKMPREKINKLSSAYADRLLTYRAMMIGRTETRLATHFGQLDVWKEAQKQGLLEENAKKVWVVDGDPCPICDPMDGVAVAIDDVWELNNGDEVEIPSQSHPHCLCSMIISFGEDEEEEVESDED